MVRKCERCGVPAPDDLALFCNRCGSRVTDDPVKKIPVCTRCGTPAPDELALFCNRCGSKIAQEPAGLPLCPACGAPWMDGMSLFCNKCGTPLPPMPPGPARPQERPPANPVPLSVPVSRKKNAVEKQDLPAGTRAGELLLDPLFPQTEKKPARRLPVADEPDWNDGRIGISQAKERKKKYAHLPLIADEMKGKYAGSGDLYSTDPAGTPPKRKAAPQKKGILSLFKKKQPGG